MNPDDWTCSAIVYPRCWWCRTNNLNCIWQEVFGSGIFECRVHSPSHFAWHPWTMSVELFAVNNHKCVSDVAFWFPDLHSAVRAARKETARKLLGFAWRVIRLLSFGFEWFLFFLLLFICQAWLHLVRHSGAKSSFLPQRPSEECCQCLGRSEVERDYLEASLFAEGFWGSSGEFWSQGQVQAEHEDVAKGGHGKPGYWGWVWGTAFQREPDAGSGADPRPPGCGCSTILALVRACVCVCVVCVCVLVIDIFDWFWLFSDSTLCFALFLFWDVCFVMLLQAPIPVWPGGGFSWRKTSTSTSSKRWLRCCRRIPSATSTQLAACSAVLRLAVWWRSCWAQEQRASLVASVFWVAIFIPANFGFYCSCWDWRGLTLP